MKKLLFCICLTFVNYLYSQEVYEKSQITLLDYIHENPVGAEFDIVYEGTTLKLNSNGEYLFCQLKVLNPELQMRLLMEGITFYIAPTGKESEKYSIRFPAASKFKDLEQLAENHKPRVDSIRERKPDIEPLIRMLSVVGINYCINEKKQPYDNEWFAININQVEQSIIYTFIVPVKEMLLEQKLSEVWKFGIYSANLRRPIDEEVYEEENFLGGDLFNRGNRFPPQNICNESNAQNDLQTILMNDIDEWMSFSFSEINSLN